MASRKTSKATSGFTPGVALGSRPSQGGSHTPDDADIIVGHKGFIGDVPTMAHNSADGVLTRPKGHDASGWNKADEIEGGVEA